jgi:hypothetical protein
LLRQSPTLPWWLEWGNPLCVKIFLGKRLSCFPAISVIEPRETNKSACKRQGRPSRGTPTPLGYGYLTRHLPRKITLTWVSDRATDEQVRIRETGGKETQLYHDDKVFRPRRPRKTHTCSKQTAPAESSIARGRSGTLGFISNLSAVSTLGEIHPGLGWRRRRKDLHFEGGRQHCAWARNGRVKPLNFGQGSFIFVGKALPLANPLQIHIVVGSEHGEGPPNAVMQHLAESAAHMAAQGLQATLGGASRGDVVKTEDLAEGRDSFGHGHAVGLFLLSCLGKCFGGLVEGRLELCKQPKRSSSNTS